MRILYLGLPLGALHLSRLGHRPVVAALGHPKAPGARRVRRRLGAAGTLVLGRPALDDEAVLGALRAARPDVILSWFWPARIGPRVLALPGRGAFGVHPSLLPRWRGPDPYFWAIRAGDTQTGVTLHALEAEYDTGSIIAQRRVAIANDDDAWSLARRLDAPSLAFLALAAERLAAGDELRGRTQIERDATRAPTPSAAELAVDWRAPVEEILRLVRAAAPWPGASADFAGKEVEVLEARAYEGALPAALRIAEARPVSEGVAIRAADGGILVTAVRCGERRLVGADLHPLFAQSS